LLTVANVPEFLTLTGGIPKAYTRLQKPKKYYRHPKTPSTFNFNTSVFGLTLSSKGNFFSPLNVVEFENKNAIFLKAGDCW
jgi:hypothetical protein